MISDPAGLYLSIPFCRGKCTFCNFASDAFAPAELPRYVEALIREIDGSAARVRDLGGRHPLAADTVYLGGGTPSLLSAAQIQQIFTAIRRNFNLAPDAEITMECAPGQLAPATLEALLQAGGNRLSFGVQSFADAEAAAVGRQHTAEQCLADLERVRAVGVTNVGLDLIAGLPFQTESSWRDSLAHAIAAGVAHLSVYLFEIDDESRLGRELLHGGRRFSAEHVPTEDQVASFYEMAAEALPAAGLEHYEISNFARAGRQSKHNLKYWQRAPYLGFGLDAHSMLATDAGAGLRFHNPDDLPTYLQAYGSQAPQQSRSAAVLPLLSSTLPAARLITADEALEETLFLGLRMSSGLNVADLRAFTPQHLANPLRRAVQTAVEDGLLLEHGDRIALSPRGRLLSNELFNRLLLASAA